MSFTSDDLVLVTGANGHTAQHVVDQLLALPSAPRVRGTVRSQARVAEIRKHYADVDPRRLDLVVVDDMTPEGAFDEALKGVTHIAHIASPFITSMENVEENVLQPAIAGTTSILNSAAKAGSTVRRVVVTGSFASVADISKGWRPGYTYTDADWAPLTRSDALDTALASRLPDAVPSHVQMASYALSKLLAERAAWSIASSPGCPFALTVLLPTYIFGPSILPLAKGAASLSVGNSVIWATANAGAKGGKHLDLDYPNQQDVRDVARAHVVALQKDEEEVKGKRFILAAEEFDYPLMAKIIVRNFPTLQPSTGSDRSIPHWKADSSNALRLLIGKERGWIPFEKTVVDTIQQVLGVQSQPQSAL